MSGTVIWLGSTVALWVICTVVYTAIEALVHDYWIRFAVMVGAGIAIGALASAFGYSFFILAVILFVQLAFMRRQLSRRISGDERMALKYMVPSVALVAVAVIGSYVFSVELCDPLAPSSCPRIFFERIYTPPHLVPPV